MRMAFDDAHDFFFVMAGLDPAIHATLGVSAMKGGWVYIVTNRPNGTLYIGVTSNLARRAREHREGAVEGFTKRYGLKRLVYAERHDDIARAIQREKNLKHWTRAWKVSLIMRDNPRWDDLYEGLT
jgi:putative endonuclease